MDIKRTYITQDILPIIDGLLISDACIAPCGRYHRFQMASSHKEFVDYCYILLKDIIIGKPSFSPYKNIKNGRQGVWTIMSGIHPDFTTQYKRWYINGIKIIPDDFCVSHQSLLLWYLGDGTLINSIDGSSCTLRLSTNSFSKEHNENISNRMDTNIGVKSKVTKGNRIRLKTESIPVFIDYIGRKSPVKCYSYKFDIDEWRFWCPMKKAANIIGIPYNRLSHLVSVNAVEYNRSNGGKKIVFAPEQIDKLKALNVNGLLSFDARKNSSAITKNKYNKVPQNIKTIMAQTRNNGFPFISMTNEEIETSYNHLCNIPCLHIEDRDIVANYRNNDLAINFHPHLFKVRCDGFLSPLMGFQDDEIMSNILSESVRKNKNTKTTLLNDICRHKKVKRTSVFPVRVAKSLIAKYGFDKFDILDPCGGYSSRLIGFMSQGYSGRYTCIEPCNDTVNGMVNTFNSLKPLCKTDVDINIINGCAENEMTNMNDDSMDIIFTSPPYFDLEKYDTDDKQSFVKYPDYNDWLHNFLFKIILESKRIMKGNGVFLLNVGNARHNKIVDDVDKFVSKEFRVENVFLMHSPSIWHQSTTEPIFVLRKS